MILLNKGNALLGIVPSQGNNLDEIRILHRMVNQVKDELRQSEFMADVNKLLQIRSQYQVTQDLQRVLNLLRCVCDATC